VISFEDTDGRLVASLVLPHIEPEIYVYVCVCLYRRTSLAALSLSIFDFSNRIVGVLSTFLTRIGWFQ